MADKRFPIDYQQKTDPMVEDDVVMLSDSEDLGKIKRVKQSQFKGDTGAKITSATISGDDIVFSLDDSSTATLIDGAKDLKGKDGDEVELRVDSNNIEWKLSQDIARTVLTPLSAIKGDTGAKIVGADWDGNNMKFTLDDSSTVSLVNAKIDLKGDKGEPGDTGSPGAPGNDGADGKEVELQTTPTHIQWKYDTDISRNNLVLLSDLKGADGSDGSDGREIQLQTNATHIQWKYDTDVVWNDLIALSILKGDKGDDGAKINGVSWDNNDMKFTLDDASSVSLTNAKTDLKGDTGDSGPVGMQWKGVWIAGSYDKNDGVSYQGSSYIANKNTSQTPGGSDWDILAQQGQAGAGSGDVIGPASATDKGVALFDTTTGKLLKNSTSFVQLDDGNVGIGTTNPSYKLHIKDQINGGREVFFAGETNDDANSGFYVMNGTISNGEFRPAFLGYKAGDKNAPLTFYGQTTSTYDTGSEPLIRFSGNRKSGNRINGVNSSILTRPIVQFLNYNDPLMTILANGSVGIGTRSPTEKLQVSGNIQATGNITGLNLSGTNTGDQDATDFDIKDLTDSTNLRTTWSGKQDALGFTPEDVANKGVANGYASLDANAKIPANQISALAITETFVVASQVAQLALNVEEGDVAIRTDENKTYIYNGGTAGTMADWTAILTPGGGVSSVATGTGLTGGPITSTGTISLDSTTIASLGKADTAIQDISGKEDAFTKNSAFNKDFGTTAGTVMEGNTDVGKVGGKTVDLTGISTGDSIVYDGTKFVKGAGTPDDVITSKTDDEPTGAMQVKNMVAISETDYDNAGAGIKATTFYLVVED